MDKFKEALKKHYDSKELSSSRLEQLQGIATQDHSDRKLKHSRRFNIAAVALVVCTLSYVMYRGYNKDIPVNWDRIAREVSYNHNKRMPVEIDSDNFGAVGVQLAKIDFPLFRPNQLNAQSWELIGGRYCSINSQLAAQLKIKNLKDNSIYTLYFFKRPTKIASGNDMELEMVKDGNKIKIWQERDLMLALAGP